MFQSDPPRANRSAVDQSLHSFESGTVCRLSGHETREVAAHEARRRVDALEQYHSVPTLTSLES
jgi:hypothetical protein